MFAVIEFQNDKKEYCVIPLIWLSDDKISCRWPKNVKSEEQLQTMIEELTQPKASWANYTIKQIHATKDSYTEANTAMQLILAECSSSATEIGQQITDETNSMMYEELESEETAERMVAGDLQKSNVNDAPINKITAQVVAKYVKDCNDVRKKRKRTGKNDGKSRRIHYSSDSDDQNNNKLPQAKKKAEVHFSELSTSDSGGEENESRTYRSKEKCLATPPSILHHSERPKLCNVNIRSYSPNIGYFPGSRTEDLRSSERDDSPVRSRNNSPYPSVHSLRNESAASHNSLENSRDSEVLTPSRNTSPSLHRLRMNDISVTQNNQPLNKFQQRILQDLETVKAIQDQQSTLLSQIWQTLQVKNIQALQRPPDISEFPIDRSREEWVENQQNFNYMRTRMASIGGTTVRGAVMNMMKYIMSNRLGISFNWAGSAPKSPDQRQKFPFKDTQAYKVINEAAKVSFQGRNTAIHGELTDKTIGIAVQDWLKQAKHRFHNGSKLVQ